MLSPVSRTRTAPAVPPPAPPPDAPPGPRPPPRAVAPPPGALEDPPRRRVGLRHPGHPVERPALAQCLRSRGQQPPAVPAPAPPRLDEQRADLRPVLGA